jgi:hypothetical protein
MPIATRSTCLNRPRKKLGFSLLASCKAQGYIARSNGKKFKSLKYLRKSKSKSKSKSRRR